MNVVEECVYSASKAAIESLVRVWSKELGQKYNCTVNAVNPGPVNTEMMLQSSPETIEILQKLASETPAAARLAETSDIAPLVVFLCSADAHWRITPSVNLFFFKPK